MSGILLSSYAVSPAHKTWDPQLEAELLPALCALPDVVGLEVPWIDGLHPHDDAWFLQHIPDGARLAITPLPWIMRQCGADARYGIASTDEDGRTAALDDLRRVAADVARIAADSAATVALVELHTAPQAAADGEALRRSLDAIVEWDWSGARLVIEHCDAFIPGQAYEKGFLGLADEIAAIEHSGAPVGIWLNWGRSAIEARHADAVTDQIADAARSGLLAGVAFSGAAAQDGPYGAAWADAHLPIASAHPDSASLLDEAHVRAGVEAAGDVDWWGLKVSRRPGDATAADALATVQRNLEVLRVGLAGSGRKPGR